MDLLKARMVPYWKKLHNKGHLNLAKEVLKGFSRSVFNKLCVTHSKHSNSGNSEREKKLTTQTIDGMHTLFNFII